MKKRFFSGLLLVALLAAVDAAAPVQAGVVALTPSQDNVTGGFTVQSTVKVSQCPHPCTEVEEMFEIVTLSASPGGVVQVPHYLVVDRSLPSTKTFIVTTHAVTSATQAVITAQGASGPPKSISLLVLPANRSITAFTLESGVQLSGVYGGVPAQAKIVLDYPADPNGWTVNLSVSSPSIPDLPPVAFVPSQVTFMNREQEKTVTVITQQPPVDVTVTITASSPTGSKTVDLPIYVAQLNLTIRKVELTQAIQYLDDPVYPDNSIPLVKNKPLIVRVYIDAQVQPGAPVIDIPAVRARLATRPTHSKGPASEWTYHNTRLWHTTRVRPGLSAQEQRNTPSEDNPTVFGNISFLLDPRELPSGPIDFRAEVNPCVPIHPAVPPVSTSGVAAMAAAPCHRTIRETNYDDNVFDGPKHVEFHATHDLNVKFFRIDWCPNCPLINYKPPWSARFPIINYLEQTYPVDRVHTWKANREINVSCDFGGEWCWWLVFGKLWAYWLAAGAPADTYYYALLDPRVPHGHVGGRSSTDGPWAWGRAGLELDGSGAIAAEELGHQLIGHWHAPCGHPDHPYSDWPASNPRAIIGHTGFDADKRSALPGNDGDAGDDETPSGDLDEYKDFMSYCHPRWVSPFTYCRLYDSRFRKSGPFCPPPLPLALPPHPPSPWTQLGSWYEAVLIRGAILDSIHVAELYHLLLRVIRWPEPPSGHYSIILRAADGRVLFTRRFDLQEADDRQERGSFLEVVPYNPLTAEIALVRNRDGKTLYTRKVSPNRPTVRLLYPNRGESLKGDKSITVRWTAADADSDKLSYLVLFSRDGGASWEALDIDVTDTSLELNPADLPGTDRALIRVLATDGFNTAQDDSDAPFVIEKKSPEVAILSPRGNVVIEAGTALLLRGNAFDAEDGILADKSLTWISDRDYRLGVGPFVVARLSLGLHTITLAARDSDGNVSTAAVQVEVTHPKRQ